MGGACVTEDDGDMSVHTVGGRGRRFLYRYAPRSKRGAAWGPHGECGFDAGGLPARSPCGTACWSAPLGGCPRGAASLSTAGRGEASGGRTLGYHSGRKARECAGTSLVPAVFTNS